MLRSSASRFAPLVEGLAAARGLNPKHATKQVDRLLANPKINVDDIRALWVPLPRRWRAVPPSLWRWTGPTSTLIPQATIMLSLITGHGRATPLVWLTVDTSARSRTTAASTSIACWCDWPNCCTGRHQGVQWSPTRGFGDQRLYRMLTEELCFDFIIRFRCNIAVTATTGETHTAARLGPGRWTRPRTARRSRHR